MAKEKFLLQMDVVLHTDLVVAGLMALVLDFLSIVKAMVVALVLFLRELLYN